MQSSRKNYRLHVKQKLLASMFLLRLFPTLSLYLLLFTVAGVAVAVENPHQQQQRQQLQLVPNLPLDLILLAVAFLAVALVQPHQELQQRQQLQLVPNLPLDLLLLTAVVVVVVMVAAPGPLATPPMTTAQPPTTTRPVGCGRNSWYNALQC